MNICEIFFAKDTEAKHILWIEGGNLQTTAPPNSSKDNLESLLDKSNKLRAESL